MSVTLFWFWHESDSPSRRVEGSASEAFSHRVRNVCQTAQFPIAKEAERESESKRKPGIVGHNGHLCHGSANDWRAHLTASEHLNTCHWPWAMTCEKKLSNRTAWCGLPKTGCTMDHYDPLPAPLRCWSQREHQKICGLIRSHSRKKSSDLFLVPSGCSQPFDNEFWQWQFTHLSLLSMDFCIFDSTFLHASFSLTDSMHGHEIFLPRCKLSNSRKAAVRLELSHSCLGWRARHAMTSRRVMIREKGTLASCMANDNRQNPCKN